MSRSHVLVHATASAPMSAKDLAARLTDVAHATLYRHVRALAEAGWLEKVSEHQARGAVEVRYRLAGADAIVRPGDLEGATLDDFRRFFSVFASSLLEVFERYLQRPGADPLADRVRYRTVPLVLSDDQVAGFYEELDALVGRYVREPSAEGARGRMLAIALVPDPDLDEEPAEPENQGSSSSG